MCSVSIFHLKGLCILVKTEQYDQHYCLGGVRTRFVPCQSVVQPQLGDDECDGVRMVLAVAVGL